VTAIRGYTSEPSIESADTRRVVEEHADAIVDTVEDVKYITQNPESAGLLTGSVDLEDCLESSVRTVTDRYPEADVSLEAAREDVAVRANERLDTVFVQLLENAVVHG